MPFDFSIKITGAAGQAAQFVPKRQRGSTLKVKAADIVSWATTPGGITLADDAQHNFLPVTPATMLTNEIPPQQSSNPAWVVTGTPGSLLSLQNASEPQ